MAEHPKSLQALFAAARMRKRALESSSETNTDSYRDEVNATIADLAECQKLISQLGLFSSNESLEDIATADLQYGYAAECLMWNIADLPTPLKRYLTVDYLLADLLQRSSGPDREAILRHVMAEYEKYLIHLDEYDLLSPADKKLHERYLENPSAFTLASVNDAAARRQVKVARFREEKELKQKLEVSQLGNLKHLKAMLTSASSTFPRIKALLTTMMTSLDNYTWRK
jgi:immunoglobulin-binding protein 1